MNESHIKLDPLFKGCTRPAMVFGVPLVPLVSVVAVIALLSLYTTLAFLIVLAPVYAVMRAIAKHDDQQFRLLWLKIQFQTVYFFKNQRFWNASAYSPIAFKKRK